MSGIDWGLQQQKTIAGLNMKHYVKEYFVDNVNGSVGASGDDWSGNFAIGAGTGVAGGITTANPA